MRIQHNITAMNAYRNYNNNTSAIGKNLEKLSSGYKINRAGDDAAGLAVSQKMRLQIAGLAQAQKNAKSGISYVQTAEGALQEVHEMLERMYTLAEQSANGTFDSSTDRTQLQKEVNSLMEEINRIGRTANFNGMGIFKQYVKPGAATPDDNSLDPLTNTAKKPDIAFTAGKDAGAGTFTAGSPDTTAAVTVTGVLEQSSGGAKIDLSNTTGVDMSTFEGGTLTVAVGGKSVTVKVGKTGSDLDIDLSSGHTTTKGADLVAEILEKATEKFAAMNTTGANGTTNYTKIESLTGGTGKNDGTFDSATATTTAMTYTAGSASKGSVVVDFTGLTGADVIGDTVQIGDKTYEFIKAGGTAKAGNVAVTVADDDAGAALANKFADAANASKDALLANGTLGTDANAAKVTFMAAAAGADNMVDQANVKSVEGGSSQPPATTPTKYESTITGGDANALTAGDKITIGSKVYTLSAGGTGATDIDSTTNNTFEKQINAAITKYNAEAGEDFTAAYANGKVTFTPKEGKTPTAAPTFTINDAANNISASTPTEVQENGNDDPGTITFWIGAEAGEDNKLTIDLMSLEVGNISIADPADTGVGQPLNGKVKKGDISNVDITTANAAMTQLSVIKQASDSVSNMRGTLGAMQNRLDHTLKNLSVMQENMQDAESVIRDTDVAEEMMAYTKNSILVQSAQAMLAQANQLPQGVLQLLQ